MTVQPRIITDNDTLFSSYQNLQAGDIICTRIRLKKEEDHLLLDLTERNIRLIPSATSQMASRSKCFQARLFHRFMIKHTRVIYDIHGILEAITLYRRHNIEKVVLKHDKKDAGLGIFLFRDIEDIYTQAATKQLPYPFVIQPFIENSRDIRAIFLGTYHEAYERINPDNFRNNLHCGGHATPYSLNKKQLQLCHRVMERGSFSYGHIDLMVTEEKHCYLAEINLRGGIRGAQISPADYQEKLKQLHKQLVKEMI